MGKNIIEQEPEFQTYGFDNFIGKARYDNGLTHIIFLNLERLCSINYDIKNKDYMTLALLSLIEAVKQGNKVLLTKSPGRLGLSEKQAVYFEDYLTAINSGDPNYPMKKHWKIDEPKTLEIFNIEELSYLEREYEKRIDMKGYSNPFLYQP